MSPSTGGNRTDRCCLEVPEERVVNLDPMLDTCFRSTCKREEQVLEPDPCKNLLLQPSPPATTTPHTSSVGSPPEKSSALISSGFLAPSFDRLLPSRHAAGLATAGDGVCGPAATVDTGVLGLVVVIFAVEITGCGVCGLDTIGIGVGT